MLFLEIGYVRVSRGLYNLELQEDVLKKERCEYSLDDKFSRLNVKRSELDEALKVLTP